MRLISLTLRSGSEQERLGITPFGGVFHEDVICEGCQQLGLPVQGAYVFFTELAVYQFPTTWNLLFHVPEFSKAEKP
jgi:hypothetical protein